MQGRCSSAAVATTAGDIPRTAHLTSEVVRVAAACGVRPGAHRLEYVLLEYHLSRPSEGSARIVAMLDSLAERPELFATLRTHLAQVINNRAVNTLVRDVEVDCQPGDLVARAWDRDEVHTLFDSLEFRVLRDRLFATLESAEPEAEGGFDVDGHVLGPGELPGWLDAHAPAGARIGLHVVGHWGRGTGDVRGLALASADGSAAYVDPATLTPADEPLSICSITTALPSSL